jgi:uncharacterized protein
MSSGSSKAVAESFLSALADRRIDDMSAVLAVDAVIHFPFWPGAPKRIEGRAAYIEELGRMFTNSVTSFEWLDLAMHETDEPGLVFGTARSRSTTSEGKSYENQYVYIFRIKNGLVVDFRSHFDPQPLMASFGAAHGR